MAGMVDWTNPETFKLSDDAYERYLGNNVRLHNTVVRDNPDEDMLVAMARHKGSHDAIRIDGKSLDEIIGEI